MKNCKILQNAFKKREIRVNLRYGVRVWAFSELSEQKHSIQVYNQETLLRVQNQKKNVSNTITMPMLENFSFFVQGSATISFTSQHQSSASTLLQNKWVFPQPSPTSETMALTLICLKKYRRKLTDSESRGTPSWYK